MQQNYIKTQFLEIIDIVPQYTSPKQRSKGQPNLLTVQYLVAYSLAVWMTCLVAVTGSVTFVNIFSDLTGEGVKPFSITN